MYHRKKQNLHLHGAKKYMGPKSSSQHPDTPVHSGPLRGVSVIKFSNSRTKDQHRTYLVGGFNPFEKY